MIGPKLWKTSTPYLVSVLHFQLMTLATGYSSLSYLKKLPAKTLKIDRNFIHDIHHDDDDKAITRSIIALGKALHLNIIAEGVEENEQLDFLTNEDGTLIQCYFFSKPVTAIESVLMLLPSPITSMLSRC